MLPFKRNIVQCSNCFVPRNRKYITTNIEQSIFFWSRILKSVPYLKSFSPVQAIKTCWWTVHSGLKYTQKPLHNNESKTHWILSILWWNCTASDPVYTKTEPLRSTTYTIVQHIHCRYNFRLWVSVAILTMLGDVHKRQQKQSKLETHNWQTYLNEKQKCNQFYPCLLRWVLLQFLFRVQPSSETLRQFRILKKPEV